MLLLRAGLNEDDALVPTLRRLGFRTYRHVFTPVLDVRTFPAETLEPFENDARALGFDIMSLAELGMTDGVVAKFRALHDEVYSEGSGAIPATPHLFSPGEWREDVLNEFLPDACFVALQGGEYAAFANLFPAAPSCRKTGAENSTPPTLAQVGRSGTITDPSCSPSGRISSVTPETTVTKPSARKSTQITPGF